MAQRFAISGGSWSDINIWNDGSVLGFPNSGDTIFSNAFTVNVNQNIDVISLNNSAFYLRVPNAAIPIMTSNVTPSGIVAASSISSVALDSWQAFDGSTGTRWQSGTLNVGWLRYEFPTPRTIRRYAVRSAGSGIGGGTNSNISSWTFEGSNDATNWTILDTRTGLILADFQYSDNTFTNNTGFTFYRINVTATRAAGNSPNIADLQMTESTQNATGSNAGGNFNFNTSNVTANLTGGLNLTSLVVNSVGGGTITINAPNSYIPSAVNGLLHSGTDNLIVNTLGNLSFGIFNGAQIVHTSTGNLTISGTLYQHVNGTAGGSNQTINSSGTGNIIVNGSLEGQLTGRGGETLILKSSSGIISISGNVSCRGNITINSRTITQLIIGGNLTNSSTSGNTQIIVGSPTVTVGGNVSNGAAALFQSTGGVLNVGGNVTNTSTTNNTIATNFTRINISGNVSGGTVNTIASSIATIINIDGSAFATSTGSAIFLSNSTSQVYLKGNIFNVNGRMAIHSPIVWLDQTGTTQARFFTSGGADRTLYSDNTFPNQPLESDVRNLIKFGPSSGLTGTLIMASPTDVRSGVNTDNTVGTALFDTSQLLAELNASNNPIAQRLRKVATPEILGQLLAAYKK
jgi:hypothetical protein